MPRAPKASRRAVRGATSEAVAAVEEDDGEKAPEVKRATQGRRRQPAPRVEDDSASLEVSSDESEDASDSDALEDLPQPRRRTAKKAAAPSATPPALARKRGAKAVKGAKPAGAGDGGGSHSRGGGAARGDVGTLFASVSGGAAMKSVVAEWATRLSALREAALAEVLNFLAHCCGATGDFVRASDVRDVDVTRVWESVMSSVSAGDGRTVFPVLAKGRATAARRFRRNLDEFWSRFVECVKDDLGGAEEGVVGQVLGWLLSLSSASLVPLRLTACVCVTPLSAALLHAIASVQGTVESLKGQSAAVSRGRGRPAAPVGQDILRAEAKLEVLRAWMTSLFEGVVVHRWRDVDAAVRLEVVQCLGGWMAAAPETYLQSSYTKYVGWMLNDSDAAVRRAALETLTTVYTPEHVAALASFVERFRGRLVSMTHDKSPDVGAAALVLLARVQRHTVLTPEELDLVEKCFMSSHAGVRGAVARLVLATAEFAEPKRASDRLCVFVAFCCRMDSALPTVTHVAWVVDSMWDKDTPLAGAEVLTEWNVYTGLLQGEADDDDANVATLNSDEQLVLCAMLSSAVRRLRGPIVTHGSSAGAAVSAGSSPQGSADTAAAVAEMSRVVGHALPGLFAKFGADMDKAYHLAVLVRSLDVSQLPGLADIVSHLVSAFQMQTQEIIVSELAASLVWTVTQAHARSVDMQRRVGQLACELTERALALLENDVEVTAAVAAAGIEDEATVLTHDVNLLMALRRLSKLLVRANVGARQWATRGAFELGGPLWVGLMALLARRRDASNAGLFALAHAKVVVEALRVCVSILLYAFSELRTAAVAANGDATEQDRVATCSTRLVPFRDSVVAHVRGIMSLPDEDEDGTPSQRYTAALKFSAYTVASDMELVFTRRLASTCLAPLAWVQSAGLSSALSQYAYRVGTFGAPLPPVPTDTDRAVDDPRESDVDEGASDDEGDARDGDAEEREASRALRAQARAENDAARVSRAKAEMILVPAARGAAYGAGLDESRLGFVASHVVGSGTEAYNIARYVLKEVKSHSPEVMLTMVLAALKEEMATLTSIDVSDPEWHTTSEFLMSLSSRLAMAVGVGRVTAQSMRVALVRFLQKAMNWAFEDAPGRLPFFAYLKPFLKRMRVTDIELLRSHFDKICKEMDPESLARLAAASPDDQYDHWGAGVAWAAALMYTLPRVEGGSAKRKQEDLSNDLLAQGRGKRARLAEPVMSDSEGSAPGDENVSVDDAKMEGSAAAPARPQVQKKAPVAAKGARGARGADGVSDVEDDEEWLSRPSTSRSARRTFGGSPVRPQTRVSRA